jgi:hypothetical protein
MVSTEEFEASPGFASIRTNLLAESGDSSQDPLEFEDATVAVLATRFLQAQLTPPPPAWRLILPRIVTALMELDEDSNTVALLFSKGYIEIWSLDTFRSASRRPLDAFVEIF